LSNQFGVVQSDPLHTHVLGRDQHMEPKVIKSGNATLRIHSPLAHMSQDEKRKWFQDEWENGNPVVRNIVQTALQLSDEIRQRNLSNSKS